MTMRQRVMEPSFCDCGDHAFAPLSCGFMVLVSVEDADLLRHKWNALKTSRSAVARRWVRNGKDRALAIMSRVIMGATDDQWVDHANGDATDNRRPNLRFATPAENAWNRRKQRNNSGEFKCVYPVKGGGFSAVIMKNGKRRYLGRFQTAEIAHAAYAAAAERLHGDFARAA